MDKKFKNPLNYSNPCCLLVWGHHLRLSNLFCIVLLEASSLLSRRSQRYHLFLYVLPFQLHIIDLTTPSTLHANTAGTFCIFQHKISIEVYSDPFGYRALSLSLSTWIVLSRQGGLNRSSNAFKKDSISKIVRRFETWERG